jgi:hypothetical protein
LEAERRCIGVLALPSMQQTPVVLELSYGNDPFTMANKSWQGVPRKRRERRHSARQA